MKLFKYGFFVLIAVLCNLSFALEKDSVSLACDRCNVTLSQVFLTQQGIYARVENQLLRTSSLKQDAEGFFIENYAMVNDFWICPGCGRANPDEAQFCLTKNCKYSVR